MKEFKEIELTRMRLEEKEKLRVEIQSFKIELENAYKIKSEALRMKEKTLEEMLKQKNQADERDIFLQRQHLLEDIKTQREKETDLRRNMESQLKIVQLDSNKFNRIEDDLKKREEMLKQSEKNIELKIRDEREKIKLDLERVFSEREFALQSMEIKNKQDAATIEIERAHLDRMKREYIDQQARLNELELNIQRINGETMCLRQENELLKEKLSTCMDHEFIKQENKMLKQKLNISRELIGEKSLKNKSVELFARSVQNQRRRSVTFASETNNNPLNLQNNQNSFNIEENSVTMATEMGVDDDVLPQDEEDVFQEAKSRTSAALEEGNRILEEEYDNQAQNLFNNQNLIQNELRNLYEMQIFEQRKLQETVEEVKKQMELFIFNEEFPTTQNAKNRSIIINKNILLNDSPSLSFIETAKDRLKFLENESERIEQNYRDYQHKIKSKYYPINDDQENEFKVIQTRKKKDINRQFDVENFIDLTLKANLKTKHMKEELEQEMIKQANLHRSKFIEQEKIENLKIVENLIRAVSMPPPSNSGIDTALLKNQLISEENEFNQFSKSREFISSINKVEEKSPVRYKEPLKKPYLEDLDEDDTITLATIKENEKITPQKNALISESKESISVSIRTKDSPKKSFEINDYKNMFKDENKTNEINNSKKSPSLIRKQFSGDETQSEKVGLYKPKTRNIKIEYSNSSTNSSSSNTNTSSDDFDNANLSIGKNKNDKNNKKNSDDDNDDFGW
jgi:hypothetical protein